MAVVAVFHSVLGLRAGTEDAATRLAEAGHDVRVVDQYEGRSFDAYEPAMAFGEGELGFGELVRRGLAGVEDLEDGFVALGFSNGAAMAELTAFHRRVAGVVCFAGAIPPAAFAAYDALPEGTPWPAGVPVQAHLASVDPFREEPAWLGQLEADVRASGATFEAFEYPPPAGHLFTDPALGDEFDPDASERAWERVLAFVDRVA